MKTKHLALIMAVMTMTACSNEVMDGTQGRDSEIGFSMYTSTQTRGIETDIEVIKSSNFGIMAYHTGADAWATKETITTPNVMYNQKVTFSENVWIYSPMKYWPEATDTKISFFAYAPYATTDNGIALSANNATGAPSLTFTVNANPTKMVDLITDAKTDCTKAGGKVQFTMKHALSRVTFDATAIVENEKTTISVKSARLLSMSSLYQKAVCQLGGNWSYTGATTYAEYALANILNLTDEALALNTIGTAISLFKDSEFLFLVPVDNAIGTASSGDIKVEFTYDVTTIDASLVGGKFTTENTKVVELPAGALKKGTAYKYTFNFTPTAIEVGTVDVATWGTEEQL